MIPRSLLRGGFNALAETYDMLRFVQVCARRLVELAALPPGAQVSDIATGTGWAAIAAAQHVGPTGRVLGVDLAPELLVHLHRSSYAMGSPVIYLGYESTSLYSTFNR